MRKLFIDWCIDAITGGTRPIRIFVFGGTFLAFFLWMGLANYFNFESDIGKNFDLPNALLIGVSILFGFGSAFGIVHFADRLKRKREIGP